MCHIHTHTHTVHLQHTHSHSLTHYTFSQVKHPLIDSYSVQHMGSPHTHSPVGLWSSREQLNDYRTHSKHCYFRAAKLYVDLAEANDKLQEVTEVSTVERGREVTEVREGGREVTEVSTVEREGGSCRYTVEPPNKGHIGK